MKEEQILIRRGEGLYTLFMNRLMALERVKGEVISFPVVRAKICPSFCLTKQACLDILLLLRDVGLIEFVPCHGIRILHDN